VWSRNLANKEALAHSGLLGHQKKKVHLLFLLTIHHSKVQEHKYDGNRAYLTLANTPSVIALTAFLLLGEWLIQRLQAGDELNASVNIDDRLAFRPRLPADLGTCRHRDYSMHLAGLSPFEFCGNILKGPVLLPPHSYRIACAVNLTSCMLQLQRRPTRFIQPNTLHKPEFLAFLVVTMKITDMRRITTFQSTTDRKYDGSPIRF